EELVAKKLLIAHKEVVLPFIKDENAYVYLEPEQLAFISYPYEWSFSMLKDAALLTLQIANKAMQYGMMLKDATPYNVQFYDGRMAYIDTLSFEIWDGTKPWIAYRQFCMNFLAPLALMHYSKLPLQNFLLAYPEGVPLQIAAAMLPLKTKFNVHLYLHLHLNASVSSSATSQQEATFSADKLKNIFKSLEAGITALRLNCRTTWSAYYAEAGQRDGYVENKKRVISEWIKGSGFKTAFDAGANDGNFSELLAAENIYTISADGDHYAVDELYKNARQNRSLVHPLIVDLANPSPAIGINNGERKSLFQRVGVDLVMALAVIHHLAIARNIPFDMIAHLFKSLGKYLLIEFVPRDDEKIQLMLSQKKDVYDWYTENEFRMAFAKHYQIVKTQRIAPSNRVVYLMHPHEL
ncbi:MAG TPA: hypothetical protein VEY06_08535, partial [Flavisolibacter sp.]|nr:hypothetical protein [Flavisolibacter sp.]